MLLLPPGYSYPAGPLDLTAQLLAHGVARLPDHPVSGCPEASAPALAPSIFGAPRLGG